MTGTCAKIRPLLPLYRNNFSTQNESEAVESHLCECKECLAELKRIGGKFPRKHSSSDGTAPPVIKNRYIRYVVIALVAIVFIAVTVILFRYRIWLDSWIYKEIN